MKMILISRPWGILVEFVRNWLWRIQTDSGRFEFSKNRNPLNENSCMQWGVLFLAILMSSVMKRYHLNLNYQSTNQLTESNNFIYCQMSFEVKEKYAHRKCLIIDFCWLCVKPVTFKSFLFNHLESLIINNKASVSKCSPGSRGAVTMTGFACVLMVLFSKNRLQLERIHAYFSTADEPRTLTGQFYSWQVVSRTERMAISNNSDTWACTMIRN